MFLEIVPAGGYSNKPHFRKNNLSGAGFTMISRRRLAFPLFGLFFAAQAFAQGGATAPTEIKVETPAAVPQYGLFEIKISGLPSNTKGVAAFFTLQDAGRVDAAEGFRDGDLWRVRFMPSLSANLRKMRDVS